MTSLMLALMPLPLWLYGWNRFSNDSDLGVWIWTFPMSL